MGLHLEAKGLFHAATLAGMAMELKTLDGTASTPEGVTISKVDDADTLGTWCRIMTSVSEFPDFAAAAWLEMYKGMEIRPVRVDLLDNGERQFHKGLESYLREGYGFADQEPGDRQHKAIGFVMTTFQKLAASSTRAIKSALQKRLTNL